MTSITLLQASRHTKRDQRKLANEVGKNPRWEVPLRVVEYECPYLALCVLRGGVCTLEDPAVWHHCPRHEAGWKPKPPIIYRLAFLSEFQDTEFVVSLGNKHGTDRQVACLVYAVTRSTSTWYLYTPISHRCSSTHPSKDPKHTTV